jgi:hypothetical protein
VAFQWRLGFGVSRGRRGGVYTGEKCIVIRRDSKSIFVTNLILYSMIIGRIQNGIEMSLLRSKTLLWVGVLWSYGLGTGPRAGGGSTRCGAGNNTALTSGGERQSGGARCGRGSLPWLLGYAGVNPVLPG